MRRTAISRKERVAALNKDDKKAKEDAYEWCEVRSMSNANPPVGGPETPGSNRITRFNTGTGWIITGFRRPAGRWFPRFFTAAA